MLHIVYFPDINSLVSDPKMTDIYDVCEANKEGEYDYPTDVVRVDEIAARRVETTPNPAYGTVTCSQNKQGTYTISMQI